LTSLGIGEALITALNEKGIPTPLIHTMGEEDKIMVKRMEQI
jgi:hypothetical protein